MRGALMVCGTSSDAGKSTVVAGLCRVLARRGLRVAPFKAQNMALNSFVTASGHEIGRAQAAQAMAAGVEPEVAMNPVLLKPTTERTSQVVVMGRPAAHMEAAAYHAEKRRLLPLVAGALEDLRERFDAVVVEGAGSPAEINLLDRDLVNLGLAEATDLPALVVGDIDRGGVFAALYGTVALLPEHLRRRVHGFVINKFRGDPGLLEPALAELERRTGVPTLGVLPWLDGVGLEAEDSLSLAGPRPGSPQAPVADALDVVVLRLPRIANFTDFDPLALEPGVSVRLVEDCAGVGDPDLVVLPGTKATVADLGWIRGRGLDGAVRRALGRGATTIGICGGYQMMGEAIVDEVESGQGRVPGLGLLPLETGFGASKVTRQRRGAAMGERVSGYEIRHGRPARRAGAEGWVRLDDAYGTEEEGASGSSGACLGTSLHGVFDEDRFRAAFLARVAERRGKRFEAAGVSFAAARDAQFDLVADAIEAHLDLAAVDRELFGAAASGAGGDPGRHATKITASWGGGPT